MTAGPITIRDVARRAGVSTGTVSRALRGSPLISAPCIDRVRMAASDLAYRPLRRRTRRSDRALAGRTIAVVLLGMDSSLTGHPAIVEALHGVEAALGAAGATLLLADIPALDALPPALARGKVDGLILKGAMQGEAIARCAGILGARLRALPAVWVTGRPSGCDWGDAAGSDDRAAGTIAADALIAAGHRQVAIINPKPDHVLFVRREDAFTARCRRAGVVVGTFAAAARPWTLPLRPVHDAADVDALVAQALASLPKPTALFAPADSIAALVYRALAARRLRVGKDVSVVSVNHDAPIVAALYPALTTVDIHARAIGRKAVDLLAARILAGPDEPAIEAVIAPTLVDGESIRQLR